MIDICSTCTEPCNNGEKEERQCHDEYEKSLSFAEAFSSLENIKKYLNKKEQIEINLYQEYIKILEREVLG